MVRIIDQLKPFHTCKNLSINVLQNNHQYKRNETEQLLHANEQAFDEASKYLRALLAVQYHLFITSEGGKLLVLLLSVFGLFTIFECLV